MVTARRVRAGTDPEAVAAFSGAWQQSLDWLFDPANRAEAIAFLRREISETTEKLGEVTRGFFPNPERGCNRDGGINMDGACHVMDMRSRYMKIGPALTDPEKHVDMTCFEQAK